MLSNHKGLGHKIALALITLAVALSGFGFAPRTASAALPDNEVCVQYHTVQRGETLARIARQYGVDWRDMARINELEDPSLIYTGQRLCVKTDVTDDRPPVQSGFYFDVISVVGDKNVTIRIYNAPADTQFDVLMDKRGTTGIDGYVVERINSGRGGTLTDSFDIPTALRDEGRIVIRVEGVTTGHFYYNTFINTTSETDDRPPAQNGFYFDILQVVKNKSVTIKVYNAPANTRFDVLMDVRGTTGVDGYQVERINTGKGGTFTDSYDIPTALRGEGRIVIRLEGVTSGRYFYDTFVNATAGNREDDDVVLPREVGVRVDTTSRRLHSGKPADLYRGNLGVSLPSSSYDGRLTLTRMDLNDTRRLEFVARGIDVQVDASNADENGKVRGLVYVYFNLDEDLRELWRDGDLNIYRYDRDERAWVECPTTMVKSKNRPYGRLSCPITSFGVYGLAVSG